jgi:hypothetical protein
MYLVDANVTGDDRGTSSVPKFSLRLLWEHILLPAYDELVAVGDKCGAIYEGEVIVVHQEDNASAHTAGVYHEWLSSEFIKRGWRLELQAAQSQTRSLTLNPTMTLTSYPQPKP